MAKLVFAYPIEEVHGKLKGKFGANCRSAKNAKGERKPFSVQYGTRDLTNKPLSTAEITARSRFKTIQAMVATRRKDVSQRSADQAAFKAQSTYPTLTKYLWAVCIQAYDAAQED
ncbi:MAG: hypothetical protein MJZ48_00100 [Paludibacteraceae bacterium]|nr:hypothetical protein [Paludibacteraceae bacterium]